MSDFFKFEYIDPKNIILNNSNEDYGTFIQGNKSGIQISTFQQPTHLTFKSDFIGGFVQDVISIRGNVGVGATGQGRMFSPSINDEITGDFPSDSIIIYQTGQGYGNVSSKGPYLRLGYHNIISEVPDSRLGIGTLFPIEKVHISGGNLRVEGNVFANNLYTKDNPSGFITGVDLSTYATNSNLFLTGQNLDNKINLLSGNFEEENILAFTVELPSGEETAFLTYPFSLDGSPSSITCSFQNTIDNVIYTYTLGQITQSGFYANFSDILSNSGYLLKVKVKK